MEVVQTINEEIVKELNITAADVNYSKNGFSLTSPKQSKFELSRGSLKASDCTCASLGSFERAH